MYTKFVAVTIQYLIHVEIVYLMYSEFLIFKISLMYTHVFLIMSGFASFKSLKNSTITLPVPRRQEVLIKYLSVWTDEEYMKFIFQVHVIITRSADSNSSVNVVMTTYFNTYFVTK